jgi:DNA (cytosine-5)-methyltransferase 1
MLTPRELARAMSFPDSYQFSGNREAVVKQIGNAVDGSQAQALCEAVLA